MMNASGHFDHQLPEVFAGLPRAETPFPIAYPTAARPQAWAAGTPVLLLQHLLGLQPDRRQHQLRSVFPLDLPSWAGTLRLSGSEPSIGSGTCVSTTLASRWRNVADPLRVAVLSPVWFAVPPTGYGGIELVVSLLADGLAEAGHDVTLFASGDSLTKEALLGVPDGAE